MECIVCGQNNWLPKYKKLKLCKYCGLVRARDIYFKKDSKKIYTDTYFNGIDYLDYASEKPALKRNFLNRIKLIAGYKKRGKLLDVGCAYGYFLKIARQKGFQPTGIELNNEIAKKAKLESECKVLTGDMEKLSIPKGSFD